MKSKEAIRDLRNSFELRHCKWAKNCLDTIEEELEKKENTINEMTEVRPDELNKEALRLYNTIMQILDKNEQLETNNQKLIEKLKETRNNLEKDGFVGYADEVQEILEI